MHKVQGKGNKNDSLYQLLEISRKKIIKKKKANLTLQIIRKRVPFFLQPIRSYQIVGDLIVNDSIFAEQTTTNSNCLLFNLNSYKKITQIFFDEELSLQTIKTSSYFNASSPNLGLLIARLQSLSNYQANTFASVLMNISKMFSSFKQMLISSTFTKSTEENQKNMSKFEELKHLTEKRFLSNLDQGKPLIMVNSIYNHEINNFEINEIKINSKLMNILGYQLQELVEQFLNVGIPGLMIFEDYFQGLSNILQSRLSGQGCVLKIKLITCDEDHLYGEAKTHSCKVLYENFFWSSFAFEIDIYPWSLQRYKGNRMKLLKSSVNFAYENLADKNQETEKFMNKFYPDVLKEKFQGKFIFKRAGFKGVNSHKPNK